MLDKPKPKEGMTIKEAKALTMAEQLKLEPQELKPRIIHDPNDGRPLIQNGGGEILDPFPPGSKAETLFMGERLPVGPPSRDDFSWDPDGPNAEDIVCRRQPATACYINQNGSIVIRQEADWDDDRDTVAIITPDNAGAVTDRVMKLAREAK